MKILWLVNVVMPEAGMALNVPGSVFGGWLTGALNGIRDMVEQITIVAPSSKITDIKSCDIDNVKYILIPNSEKDWYQQFFRKLIDVNHDLFHIFGTEYGHAEALLSVADPNKTVVSIQGLMAYCTYHYLDGIPEYYTKDTLDRRILRRLKLAGKSIGYQYKEFASNVVPERRALLSARYVIGRTNWDHACIKQINPKLAYYSVNETLRDSFYDEKHWKYQECEKHTIFMSQAGYSIKGLHFLLEALPYVRQVFPDVKVYIAGVGSKFEKHSGIRSLFDKRYGGYRGYLQWLVDKNQLHAMIEFTGQLSEKEMVCRYLKANVYVLSSTIENSPNSLGEAMMLGVPCVAAYVGGVPDMLIHEQEGILYQPTAPYMLADAVIRIFKDVDLAEKFSTNASLHAKKIYDRKLNGSALINVYNRILNKGK